uniref:TAFA chemokine like family member 5 n=1 Tax=Crocodylus porosus TaxID=8502 RepID=A0A7M4E5I4_CROPO
MPAGWRELSAGGGAALCCLLCFWLLYSQPPKEGKELEVGMCEITALDRDLSHPRRMIARQTARCACRRGQVAGTTRAKPACVDAQLIASKQWCGMEPCDEGEQCTLLINRSGWSCTRRLGRIKTVTIVMREMSGREADLWLERAWRAAVTKTQNEVLPSHFP